MTTPTKLTALQKLKAALAAATSALAGMTTSRDTAIGQVGVLTGQVSTLTDQVAAALAQVAALTAERDGLKAQNGTLAAEVENLQNMLDAESSDVDMLNAEVADLQAQVANLQAQIVALTPKPRPAVKFLIGGSCPSPALGDFPIMRTYSPGRIGPAPSKATVHSFKTWDEAEVRAFVKAAPKGQILTYFHEPEDNVVSGSLKPADFAARQILLCQIIRELGRVGDVRPATVLMEWSLRPQSNRTDLVPQLLTPQVVAALKSVQGIGGWDAYAGPDAAEGPNRTPDDLYGTPARYSANLGLPWAIMETGARQTKISDPKLHASWWQGVFDFLASGKVPPPVVFTAWNPVKVMGDPPDIWNYQIQDLVPVAAVWKKAISTFCG